MNEKILSANLTLSKPAFSFLPDAPDAKDVLKKRANLYAQPMRDNRSDINLLTYLHFKLGVREYYGVPYKFAIEVVNHHAITYVPYAPKYIAGVINRRVTILI